MNTKTCKVCGLTKEIDLFCKNTNGYYLSRCKLCDSERRKQWNEKNPEKYTLQIQKICRNQKVSREKLREQINREKKGCSYCGYNQFIECLQFHHLDPLVKEYDIGRMVARVKNERDILEEIKKCIVLCANCHNALHHGDIRI